MFPEYVTGPLPATVNVAGAAPVIMPVPVKPAMVCELLPKSKRPEDAIVTLAVLAICAAPPSTTASAPAPPTPSPIVSAPGTATAPALFASMSVPPFTNVAPEYVFEFVPSNTVRPLPDKEREGGDPKSFAVTRRFPALFENIIGLDCSAIFPVTCDSPGAGWTKILL